MEVFSFLLQNRFVLEGALEIHNGGQNARFGSALAPVPDLNGDGLNDLVVGAPLEDDHKGAIYVFFSQQSRIMRKYKQVQCASNIVKRHTCYLYIYFLMFIQMFSSGLFSENRCCRFGSWLAVLWPQHPRHDGHEQ